MDWVDRIGFAIAGGSFVALLWIIFGGVTIGGDFLANVAGAIIGGLTSVGLALYMFNRQQIASAKVLSDQRELSAKEAEYEASKLRAHTITRSLRHIHSIRDAVKAAKDMTRGDDKKIIDVIESSGKLTRRVLSEDISLTDFDLRLAMERAADQADEIEKTLRAKLGEANKNLYGNVLPIAGEECKACLETLDEISAKYRAIRNNKQDWEIAL